MVGHGGSSAGSYLADPTSPIPSHCGCLQYDTLFSVCSSEAATKKNAIFKSTNIKIQLISCFHFAVTWYRALCHMTICTWILAKWNRCLQVFICLFFFFPICCNSVDCSEEEFSFNYTKNGFASSIYGHTQWRVRVADSRLKALVFHLHCWSCAEVSGKLLIQHCLWPPNSNVYLGDKNIEKAVNYPQRR